MYEIVTTDQIDPPRSSVHGNWHRPETWTPEEFTTEDAAIEALKGELVNVAEDDGAWGVREVGEDRVTIVHP